MGRREGVPGRLVSEKGEVQWLRKVTKRSMKVWNRSKCDWIVLEKLHPDYSKERC